MTRVTLSKEMFVAAAVLGTARHDAWEYLPVLKATLDANAASPLGPDKWFKAFSSMAAARQRLASDPPSGLPKELRYIDKILESVESEIWGSPMVVDRFREFLKETSFVKRLQIAESDADVLARGSVYLDSRAGAAELFGRLYDTAQTSSAAADYWDRFLGRELGSVRASPQSVVQEHPELRPLLTALDSSPQDATAVARMEEQIQEQLVQLAGLRTDFSRLHSAVDLGRADLATLAQQAAESQRLQADQAKLAALMSGLRGVSAVYQFLGGNARTAGQLNALLSAFAGLQEAGQVYRRTALLSGSGWAAFGAFGTIAGIMMSLSTVFGDDAGATGRFEDGVGRALGQISNQLAALQNQVAKGFQYVDARLDGLSRQLEAGLAALSRTLQDNGYRLDNVSAAVNNLSRSLHDAARIIVDRIDYLIELQDRSPILLKWDMHRVAHRYLNQSELDDLHLHINLMLNRAGDARSGRPLNNLEGDWGQCLAQAASDRDAELDRNINALRSIATLLGVPLSGVPVCSPTRWQFACAAFVEISVNNAAPGTALNDTLLQRLNHEGQRLVDERASIRRSMFTNQADQVDLIFAFLLQKYTLYFKQLIASVEAVHQANLRLACPQGSLTLLPEFEQLWAECKEVAIELGTGRSTLPVVTLVARPATLAEAFVPEPAFPGTGGDGDQFNAWLNYPGLADCAPSIRSPEAWPVLAGAGRAAWSACFPGVTDVAVLGAELGVGTISIQYQAQIDQMRWDVMDNLIGRPNVHLALVRTRDGQRSVLARCAQSVADSHLGERACFHHPRPIPTPGLVNLKSTIAISMAGVMAVSDPNLPTLETLTLQTGEAYDRLAQKIRHDLREQLGTPDSEIGQAVGRLSATVGLIRAAASWLFGDRLAAQDPLLRCLYGAVEEWAPSIPGVDLRLMVDDRTGSARRAVSLLDHQELLKLFALTPESEAQPQDWPSVALLSSLEAVLDASLRSFSAAMAVTRRAADDRAGADEISDTLAMLKLVARQFS